MKRFDRVPAWVVAAALVVGFAALIDGLVRLGGSHGSFDGGYSTSTVGAPAYAAVFTFDLAGRGWLEVGTALAAVGCVVLVGAAWRRGRRTRGGRLLRSSSNGAEPVSGPYDGGRARWMARIGTAFLVLGLVGIAAGIGRLPRHVPKFGDEPPGFPDIPIHLPGRPWVEGGALLVLLGGAGLLRLTWRPEAARTAE